MAFWGETYQLQQKKADEDEKLRRKCSRYNLLYQHVFLPLSHNIVDKEDNYYDDCIKLDEDGFTKLLFDKSDVRNSRHYNEGQKHLVKDIDKFQERYKTLEDKVKHFNKNLDDFKENDIEKLVLDYIKTNNFEIITHNDEPPSNTIVIDNLLSNLKSYWYKNIDFGLNVWTNETKLRIRGEIIASFSNDEEKSNIENLVNNLKNHNEIVDKISYFKNEPENIISEGRELSKEIENKVVKEIENENYNTICEEYEF